jgi:hypothetical protein
MIFLKFLKPQVRGDSQLFSSEFQTMEEVKKEEVINTALLFGWLREKIDFAIKAVWKPNEALQIDDVLAYLQKHYPL